MTAKAKQFREELIALLVKYDCYLEAKDHWEGYPECGQDVRITVDFAQDYSLELPYYGDELDLRQQFDKNS